MNNHQQNLTHPSFCGGIGTLPSLSSFDTTDVTFTPPVGCQMFFTFSTKPTLSFLSKNSTILLFFTRNSAWYRGISEKQNKMNKHYLLINNIKAVLVQD